MKKSLTSEFEALCMGDYVTASWYDGSVGRVEERYPRSGTRISGIWVRWLVPVPGRGLDFYSDSDYRAGSYHIRPLTGDEAMLWLLAWEG